MKPGENNNHLGAGMNKYSRKINGHDVDVYDVLGGFDVECHAIGHAIKKLLAPGKRGHKTVLEDKQEAIKSIQRSIMIDASRAYLESVDPALGCGDRRNIIKVFDDFLCEEDVIGSYAWSKNYNLGGLKPCEFIEKGGPMERLVGRSDWPAVNGKWKARLRELGEL